MVALVAPYSVYSVLLLRVSSGKAVSIALEDDYVSYKYIRQLCEQIDFANKSNGKLTLGASDQAPKFTVCENIRGNYE